MNTATTATATIELPQEVYALAQEAARARHVGLSEFVAEAVQKTAATPSWKDAPWMKTTGDLSDLHEENKRIQHLIDEEFGLPKPEALSR